MERGKLDPKRAPFTVFTVRLWGARAAGGQRGHLHAGFGGSPWGLLSSCGLGLQAAYLAWQGLSGEGSRSPAILPCSAPGRAAAHSPGAAGWVGGGALGMSVSSWNGLVWLRGNDPPEENLGWAHTFSAAGNRKALGTIRWSFGLQLDPALSPGQEGGAEMPSKLSGEGGQPEPQPWGRREVTLSGAARESLGAQLRCGGRAEVRTARACESMSIGGATGASVWPEAHRGSMRHPSRAPRLLPLLSIFLLQLCLFWNGTVLSPWDSCPSLRSLRGQFGLLQSHPVFHGSLNQPHRECAAMLDLWLFFM